MIGVERREIRGTALDGNQYWSEARAKQGDVREHACHAPIAVVEGVDVDECQVQFGEVDVFGALSKLRSGKFRSACPERVS